MPEAPAKKAPVPRRVQIADKIAKLQKELALLDALDKAKADIKAARAGK